MGLVKVRNINIGEGLPKVCIPLMGINKEEIIAEAKKFKDYKIDIVEWRVDFFEYSLNMECVETIITELRKILNEVPILFTFRTSAEGGKKYIEKDEYLLLCKKAIDSNEIDLIDVEVFSGDSIVNEIVTYAHNKNVKVIMSNHDFEKTPERKEIVNRLIKMYNLGCDIAKIAVMPTCKRDVLTLLQASLEMEESFEKVPIVTISMANLGSISRYCGGFFGSSMTFASIDKSSAPGQVNILDLQTVLNIIYKKTN